MYLETYPTLRESEIFKQGPDEQRSEVPELLAVKLKRRRKDITLEAHNMPATMLGI